MCHRQQDHAPGASPSSSFFLEHRDLFDFDRQVGCGPITCSTPSFLEQYRACENQDAPAVLPTTNNIALTVLNTPYLLPTVSIASLAQPCPQTFPAPARSQTTYPRTPCSEVPQDPDGSNNFQLQQVAHSTSSSRHRKSTFPFASLAPLRKELPKLSNLLIDASTRSALASSKRTEDAKKIEVLVGSKWVGRISAAASSSLPAAIRNRLHASHLIQERRERLYILMKEDYSRLIN